MVEFLYLSAMNTLIHFWFYNLSLSSGILPTHLRLNMVMFAASDLEGLAEYLVHFVFVSTSAI